RRDPGVAGNVRPWSKRAPPSGTEHIRPGDYPQQRSPGKRSAPGTGGPLDDAGTRARFAYPGYGPKKTAGRSPPSNPMHPSNSEEVVPQRHVPVARQAVVRGLDVADAGELLAFGLVVLVGQVAHARAYLPAVLRRIPHAVQADQGVGALAEHVPVVHRQPGLVA